MLKEALQHANTPVKTRYRGDFRAVGAAAGGTHPSEWGRSGGRVTSGIQRRCSAMVPVGDGCLCDAEEKEKEFWVVSMSM